MRARSPKVVTDYEAFGNRDFPKRIIREFWAVFVSNDEELRITGKEDNVRYKTENKVHHKNIVQSAFYMALK